MNETSPESHGQGDQEPLSEPREWTVLGFLNEFMRTDKIMRDRSFAFILGAGASVSSKIPGAAKLARDWVEELYQFYAEGGAALSFERWATPENLGIAEFSLDRAATFYSQVYDKRFGDDPESGYAYLEDAMKAAEPNIGYSILAKVLENTRHKVVITTNFDNLVADALSIYTDTFPLVCGHESLASFVRSRLRRPLIAKIHRDLLLAPKSSADGTSSLDDRWARVLRNLLRDYTPVVIGYGGNDGSLMDFLDELEPGEIQGGIYWCYHRAGGKPDERIRHLVARHKGKLIPIVGFDEFMIQLGERLQYGILADEIEQRAQKRVKAYRDQWEQCQKRLAQPAGDALTEEAVKPIRQAFAATVEREDSWWSWELKAQNEPNPDRQEAIYRQGLQEFPTSAELAGNFANFMANVRKEHDEAERLYRRALELDPNEVIHLGNFANFMTDIRRNHDEAERLYRRALELDPNNAANTGNFGGFLLKQRRLGEAETQIRNALALDKGKICQLAGEVLLYWCLAARMTGRSDTTALRRLKYVLEKEFVRQEWSFAQVLAAAEADIPSEEMAFYRALADAILDDKKVKDLEGFERWKQIRPVPLDQPWDPE